MGTQFSISRGEEIKNRKHPAQKQIKVTTIPQ